MILSNFFFTTTSSQEIICYITEQQSNLFQGETFWKELGQKWSTGENKCTSYIFKFESETLSDMRVAFSYLGLFQKFYEINNLSLGFTTQSTFLRTATSSFGIEAAEKNEMGMNIIWDIHSNLPASQKFMQHMNEWTPSSTIISQAIYCRPGTSEVIDPARVVTKYAKMTIVLVKVKKEHLPTFLENPYDICVLPLVNLGIPKNKIAIGLTEVVGYDTRFREVCKNEPMKKMLTDIAQKLSCMVKAEGLYGVMVWSIGSDDFTGQKCGMGKFPLVAAHTVTCDDLVSQREK